MSALRLTRRSSLLLPFLLAACGGDEPVVYKPLRYEYLRPIDLNVKAIDFEQRFVPSGVAPDISGQCPVDPVATLRQMGDDRLKPLGGSGRAVFSISDASLIRREDLIRGLLGGDGRSPDRRRPTCRLRPGAGKPQPPRSGR